MKEERIKKKQNKGKSNPGGERDEAWDRETMFSQLTKRGGQRIIAVLCGGQRIIAVFFPH